MYRKTYVEIDLKSIESNIKKVVNKFSDYKYFFGVIKANSYGCGDLNTLESMINGGCNYLAVATLEEALEIREKIKTIPIICFGVIQKEYLEIASKNNITITINSLEYAKEIESSNVKDLKVHIKLNTGMNRLGISNVDELLEVCKIIRQKSYFLEGIYTHVYNAKNENDYMMQINKFKSMIENIENIEDIPIIHVPASEALVKYPKLDFINGCRLGKIMYGFTIDESLKLDSIFRLYSEVVQINCLKKGETVRI